MSHIVFQSGMSNIET
uniref:Uncharacterized protein n=1 Tax=Arundo donax TaxID=35708 RepID=A0A0A9H916_ARUDO